MRRLSIVVLASLFACGGGASSAPPPSDARAGGAVTADLGHPNLGDEAPDFELKDAKGQAVKLSSLRGSIVVVHFGASWCPYCVAELPNLEQLAKDYGPRGVKAVWIDVKEPPAKQAELEKAGAATFAVLWDEDGAVAAKYAPERAQPDFKDRSQVTLASNLVVDRAGKIRFYTLLDSAAFDAKLTHVRVAVDRLLAAP